MIRFLCLPLASVLLLSLPAAGNAQPADPKDEFQFLLNAMRHERGKLHSGVCHITGRYVVRKGGDSKPFFDGPLTIFAAFEGEKKLRFDRSYPGWVHDPSSGHPDPNAPSRILDSINKKGVEKHHFYDNGDKSCYWCEDASPYISVMASLGDKSNPWLGIKYFDVRALGLYDWVSLEKMETFKGLFDQYRTLLVKPQVDRSDPAVWVIKWAGPANAPEGEFRIWVDVRRGFTPIRYVLRSGSPNSPRESWKVDWEFVTDWEQRGDVWIPVKHQYTITQRNIFRIEVNFDLSWENVNQPVDPLLFSYKTFGAPDYVGVIDSSLGQPITVKPLGDVPKPPRKKRSPWPYVVGLGILGVALAGAGARLWYRRARRVPKGSTGTNIGTKTLP